MNGYDLVFLDADDTLLDFGKSERLALEATLAPLGIEVDGTVFGTYVRINARAWAAVEAGTLDREVLKARRFAELFEALGLSADPSSAARAGEAYLDSLSEQAWLLEGALETCALLRARARLVLLTNGITRVQRGRLARSGLDRAVDAVVISEEAGFAKPDPRVFELGASLVGLSDKTRMLIVGDSLSSDIQGGVNYGIDSCWYNPRRLPLGKPQPTYEVATLAELPHLLGAETVPRGS